MSGDPNDHMIEVKLEDGALLPVPRSGTNHVSKLLPLDLSSTWPDADQVGETAADTPTRGEAIATQCACALIKSSFASLSDQLLPDLVAALVKLAVWSPELALTWIEQMPDGHRRTESLLALGPLTPGTLAHRLYTALDTTRPYVAASRANDLGPPDPDKPSHSWLAPEYYVSEQLQMTFRRASAPDSRHIEALARLARHLPPALRVKAIVKVLGVLLDEGFYRDRNVPLGEIVPLLSEEQLWHIVRTAERLPGLRQPNLDNPRAELLMVVLPRLAELGHANEAVAMARTLASDLFHASISLARIAMILPSEQNQDVLKEARSAALAMDPSALRAVALVEVSTQFAKLGYFAEAEVTASMTQADGMGTWAVAQLLEYLPEQKAAEITRELLASIDNLHRPGVPPPKLGPCRMQGSPPGDPNEKKAVYP